MIGHVHSILPHVLLPVNLFASLFSPPFPGRGAIFSSLVVLNIIFTAYDEFPAKREMRYALAGAWLFYIPVLEKLIIHHDRPELDYWRLDRQPKEALYMAPMSIEKASWAAALLANPRGVGWNHGSCKLPVVTNPDVPWAWFIATRVSYVILSSCVVEAIVIATVKMGVPTRWSWHSLPQIALTEILMAAVVYWTWILQWNFAAGASVGMGLSTPKDWPPFFGKLSDCTTVGAFWGHFWHGMLRQPALGFSHFVVDQLRVPKRSMPAYAVHLSTAFLISGLGHIISIIPIYQGYISFSEVCRDMMMFFMAQAAAIVVENLFIDAWKQTKRSPALGKQRAEPSNTISKELNVGAVAGYAWTFGWLLISGWWFVRVYIKLGVMEWETPLPIVAPLLTMARNILRRLGIM